MEWVALTLALVLILGLALARALRERWRQPPSGHPWRPSEAPALAPQDEAELSREFAAVEQESGHHLTLLLDRRLRVLATRRIPLRAIRPAPGPRTGRLVFADSTVLLARAHRPGELYRLAVAVPEHSVTLESWSHRPDGTVLHLVWPHDSAEVLAIGLDQAE